MTVRDDETSGPRSVTVSRNEGVNAGRPARDGGPAVQRRGVHARRGVRRAGATGGRSRRTALPLAAGGGPDNGGAPATRGSPALR
jgi:hypothetical protein